MTFRGLFFFQGSMLLVSGLFGSNTNPGFSPTVTPPPPKKKNTVKMNPIEAKNQQKHIHTETHLASVFDKVFDKVFVCFYFYLFFFKKWLINGN